MGRGFLLVNSFPDLLIGRAGCAAADTTCSVANPGNTTGLTSSSFNGCLFCVRSGVNGIIHNYHLQNQSAFFQDDWKVNNRLTLNIGVRWERNGTLADKYGNLTNLWVNDLASVPVPPTAPSSTDPRAFTGYVVPDNYDARPISQGGHGPLPPGVRQFPGKFASQNGIPLSNFGPRVGFAWQPVAAGRLVIRGGAGIFYGPTVSNSIGDVASLGFSTSASYSVAQAETQSVFQLRDGFPAYSRPPLTAGFGAVPAGQKPNTAVSFFNPRQIAPVSYQYNFGIQREVERDILVEVGYIGNVSHQLTANDLSLNQVPPQLMGPGNSQVSRPFPQYSNVTWINPSIGN
ncbi:MAG TPA: hypothetical protein VFF11_06920, partial [Candidatus Binatia bacterium]|nr:hypothetical protein [Candidatus Binatia bacterium]